MHTCAYICISKGYDSDIPEILQTNNRSSEEILESVGNFTLLKTSDGTKQIMNSLKMINLELKLLRGSF